LFFVISFFLINLFTNVAFFSKNTADDTDFFVNYGSSVWNGRILYGDLIDVKGPLFFDVVAISQLIPYSYVSLMLVLVINWTVCLIFVYKIVKVFVHSKNISILFSLLFILLHSKITGFYLSCESLMSFSCWMIFMYIYIRVLSSKTCIVPVKYYTALGIISAVLFWSKHENLYLILFAAVSLTIYLLFASRIYLVKIIQRLWISVTCFAGITIIVIIPLIVQSTFNNMLWYYIIRTATKSSFSIMNIPKHFLGFYSDSLRNLLLFFVSLILIAISKLENKIKVPILLTGILLFFATFSSFAPVGMANYSQDSIFNVFLIFIPLSLYTILQGYLNNSSIVIGICNILALVFIMQLGTGAILTHYANSLSNVKYTFSRYSETRVAKNLSLPIYKSNKLPFREICEKYDTTNKLLINGAGYDTSLYRGGRLVFLGLNECKNPKPLTLPVWLGATDNINGVSVNISLAKYAKEPFRSNWISKTYDYILNFAEKPNALSDVTLSEIINNPKPKFDLLKYKPIEVYDYEEVLFIMYEKIKS
jgi:hypothetical protein